MKFTKLPQSVWSGALAALLLVISTAPVQAEEEFERFLEAMRRTQMYAEALSYLEEMQTSPLIPDEIRETIPYEQGMVLVEQAGTIRDFPVRSKMLDEAAAKFEEFNTKFPTHDLVAMSNTQLARVLLERGKSLLERAKREDEATKPKIIEEARKLLTDAVKAAEAAETRCEEDVHKYPKGKLDDPKLTDARTKARNALIWSRMSTGRAYEELAYAYEKESKEYKEWLAKALERYKETSEKYRQWYGGYVAQMYLGNIFLVMGDTVQALGHFVDMLEQPDTPTTRPVKLKVLRLAMLAWTHEKEKKFKEALMRSDAWIKAAREDEKYSPEGLAIRWLTVVATEQFAAAGSDDATDKKVLQKLQSDARKHAQYVAQHVGEFQKAAREWLVAHGNEEAGEIATFDQAYDEGVASVNILRAAKEPAQKQEAIEKAQKYFQMALSMRDDESQIEKVNACRYYLVLFAYNQSRYWDSAVLGDFIARNYPTQPTARPSARLALFSWLALIRLGHGDTTFENQQMLDIAEYLTEKWPTEPEADDASMVLLDHFAKKGDIKKSLYFLEKIKEESPRRGDAELAAGQAMWAQYLRQLALPADEKPSQEQLDGLKKQIETTLKAGIDRMRKAEDSQVTYALLAAELSLAQYYLNTAEPEKALELLDKDKGVLKLLKGGDEVTKKGNFRVEGLKAALRTYVGLQKIDEAQEIMKLLETEGGDQQVLTRIYIELGFSLQEQLEALRNNNQAAQAANVSKGFELFLDNIAGRPGNSYASLYWVASTFRSMGLAMETGNSEDKAQAVSYFDRAAKTFERMEKELDTLEPEADKRDDRRIALKIRRAEMLRRGGHPAEAVPILVEVIEAKNKSLEAQMECAYAYQEMGKTDPKAYVMAMRGSHPMQQPGNTNPNVKVNMVWGWQQLASILRRIKKFNELYQECNYNLIDCKFRYGVAQKERKYITSAKVDIFRSAGPGRGAPEHWVAKFEKLLREVDTALGQKHESLKAKPSGTASTGS